MKLVLVRPKVRKYFKSLEYLIGTVKIINRNLYFNLNPNLCLPTGIGLRGVQGVTR